MSHCFLCLLFFSLPFFFFGTCVIASTMVAPANSSCFPLRMLADTNNIVTHVWRPSSRLRKRQSVLLLQETPCRRRQGHEAWLRTTWVGWFTVTPCSKLRAINMQPRVHATDETAQCRPVFFKPLDPIEWFSVSTWCKLAFSRLAATSGHSALMRPLTSSCM